ncbi:MAG: hypothetical protein ACRDT4_05095 [Micromonosporaceae bacterium]
MAWLAVRAAFDAAIASYDALAQGLAVVLHKVDDVHGQASGVLVGSASPHAANGLMLVRAARGELGQGIGYAGGGHGVPGLPGHGRP